MPADPIAISRMAEEMVKREMAEDPEQFRVAAAPPQKDRTLSPDTLATIGGLADAASTYAFMKTGRAKEANPITAAVGGNSPERTGLAALGGLLATKAAIALVRKKSPKFADMLAANLGAQQLALGAHNTATAFDKSEAKAGQEGFGNYGDTMIRAGIDSTTRSKVR